MEKFLQGQRKPLKPLNSIQCRQGYDCLPRTHREIPFSDLYKEQDLQAVCCELLAQNLDPEGTEWTKVLLNRLKDSENNRKYFKPRCPEAFLHLLEVVDHCAVLERN